jgi:hypothetical protein
MEIREIMEKITDINHVISNLDVCDTIQQDAINLLVEYREKILDTEVYI